MKIQVGQISPLLQVLLIPVFFGLSGLLANAQTISIKILNAYNGRAVRNECLNISFGSWHGADLLAPANNNGDVTLHLKNDEVTADGIPGACNRASVLGPKPLPKDASTITISTDYYVACQEYGKIIPGQPVTSTSLKNMMPSYPIDRILKSGISASNTCGDFRAAAIPGELIFFVRPLTWLEKLRR